MRGNGIHRPPALGEQFTVRLDACLLSLIEASDHGDGGGLIEDFFAKDGRVELGVTGR